LDLFLFQDELISNADSSLPDAIVPSLTLTPSTSGSMLVQAPPPVYTNNNSSSAEHERRSNAAAAAATTALLNSWMVPQDLVAESSSGFAMVIDQSGTIEFVSETVRCHVGHAGQSMRGQSIYNYILQADQDKMNTALHPQNLNSPANVGPSSSISADPDLNYRRTFAVRFLVINATNNNYEGIYLNTVPLRKPNKSPSLLCVARKMGSGQPPPFQQQQQQQQQQQNSATNQLQVGVSNGQADLFSTRLDPTSFRILHSETDKTSFSSRASLMSGKCFLEFCHDADEEIIRAHFLETLQGNNGSTLTSKPYRMVGLFGGNAEQQLQRSVRVQTRSRYFKPVNHHEKGFIMSTHSMVRAGSETSSPSSFTSTSSPTTLTYLLSTNNTTRMTTTTTTSDPFPSSNSLVQTTAAGSSTDTTQQKNLLLKSLLNASFASTAGGDQNNEQPAHLASVSNSRILQLLSQVRKLKIK
jgi:hypothetical protein